MKGRVAIAARSRICDHELPLSGLCTVPMPVRLGHETINMRAVHMCLII